MSADTGGSLRHPAPADLWARALVFDRDHRQVVDFLAAAAFGAVSAWWLLGRPVAHGPLDWAFTAGLVLPLVFRRTQSTAVFAVVAAVALAQWVKTGPLLADAALLAALFTVASERSRREWLGALALLEVGVVMASLRFTLANSWIRNLVGLNGLAAVTVLAALVFRARRAHQEELAERARRLQLERDQQAQIAAAAERTRIAREMHDVIAHSLAVMIALADGASSKMTNEPERARKAIDQVAEAGRQALGETRRLLGVLRDSGSGTQLAPQPGLVEVDALLAQVRSTGLDATIRAEGSVFDLTAGAALTVFRIVQEASTNTLKHAVDASGVTVVLTYDWPRLRVSVTDDGRPVRAPVAPGGHGLAGMRERVGLYHGKLSAQPGPEGFEVSAVINVDSNVPPLLAVDTGPIHLTLPSNQ